MPIILPDGRKYENVYTWAEEIFNIPIEELTPEWNVAYYEERLKYTKHSVRRKKLQKELDWWKGESQNWK